MTAAFVLSFCLPVPADAAVPVQGDRLVNTVSVTSTANPVFMASATVTVIIPTPAVIEFLQYAPGVPVAPGAYRNGAETSSFVLLPPPQSLGSPAPIDLSQPVPLLPAAQVIQGEPIFIRVTDPDQNMDRTLRETIQVTVSNPATGDTEVIRLTETGPDTGVFAGYLPTTPAASVPFNGDLQVRVGNRLTAVYVDPDDPSDTVTGAVIVDPATTLWLQKSAGKSMAGHGDFIPYQVTVTNSKTSTSASAVRVTDSLPTGLRYRSGSARLNGVQAGDPAVSSDGRTLTFTVGSLAGGSSATIDYVAEVTAGTRPGAAVNSAVAGYAGGGSSNTAQATVTVRDDFLRTRSTLMGRVTSAACSDESGEGPDGVEGVRVYLEDGSFVVSDKRGLFHFEGVRAGLHVVQLDLDSLPDGYEAYACTGNSRFAGRAFSQFVETQGGTLWRTDFHVRSRVKPAPEQAAAAQPPIAPPQNTGEIVLELAGTADGQNIDYRADMRGIDMPVQAARLNVILPEGVTYEPGSSRMDGAAIVDPQVEKNRLIYRLGDLPAGWRHGITFRGRPNRGRKAGPLVTQAYLAAGDDAKARVLTPLAETTLQLDKDTELYQMPEIVTRPHFTVLGDELNADDREKLDELARLLSGLRTEKIHVTGHTDNVPIAHRSRALFTDNQALSRARARSVGHYLMDRLHIPPEKLSLDGKGGTVPLADNRTETGRALNRRVEVRITSSRVVVRPHLRGVPATGAEGPATVVKGPLPLAAEKDRAAATPAVQSRATVAGAAPLSEQPPVAISGIAAAGGTAAPAALPVPSRSPLPPPAGPALSAAPPLPPGSEGLLFPADGDLLVERINPVRFVLPSSLLPKLVVDGREVPADRTGFRSADPASGKTTYGYIGIDFGDPGQHTVVLQGLDPFGNARASHTATVTRTGDIASIRLVSAEGNVADGKTPVRMRFELRDQTNTPIRGASRLEFRDGTLAPPREVDGSLTLDDKVARRWVTIDRDGWVAFQPVTVSGSYRVVVAYNSTVVEAETYVQPKLRDWILVGLAEGTLGYNTASGNMESLQGTAMAEDLYKDGRIALFAKGQIQGKWLLTMAYDTAKTKGNSGEGLFQTINPETYFTLYGDAGQQQYDAASSKKLYIRIEREQFYAMFGDYDTGLAVTELSRYSRRLTGLKTELQGRNYEVNAFASETEQAYQRDEIPGDGTSGIYRLSRRVIVPNSEKIAIEVRDRFHSEIIVSTRTLGRFTDYSIDYESGAVIFKEPIHSRDQQFNPVTIVAEYEVVASGGQDYTYGGRAGLKLFDQRLKAGGTYIHEGQGGRSSNLYGADAALMLGQSTKLRAEFATSDFAAGTTSRSGSAYLAEVSHTSKQFDAKAYIREQEAGFGLGQQAGSETGTRKLGIDGAYRLNDRFSGSGNLYRQYNLLSNATRDVAEGKLTYTDKHYGASVGLLHADDHLGDGSNHRSTQLTLGGKMLTLYDRLTLTLDHAQSVGSNSNSDFPTRTALGADFMISKSLSLLAAQELTWGTGAITQNTRLGLRSAPWKGAALTSSIERQFNENNERVFANVGLRQTWQINEAWKVDAGLDRSHTLVRAAHYQFNTNVPPASGGSENFTAVSGGATYQVKHLTWDSRLEFRLADSENKWGLMSGLVNEVDKSWAWSGRAQLFQTSASSGIDTTKANLRYGLVFRPPQTRWIVLNRLDYLFDKQSGGPGAGLTSWRLVNNLIANYRPRKELQVSLQYGAKYVRDTIAERSYSGFTDHIGLETRYDITKAWDIGMWGSLMHSWHGGQFDYSCGPSTGYNVFDNAWVSVGYNLWGFEDRDFASAAYTAQGPYVRFRMKFDQQTVKDAAGWINKQ